MSPAARYLVQTRAEGMPWRTVESTTDEAMARERMDSTAALTLNFGPSPTAPKFPMYPHIRVMKGGAVVYTPVRRLT